MKDFKLKLSGDIFRSEIKILEILNFKRKLLSIEISDVTVRHEPIMRIIRKFADSLRTLSMSSCEIDDFTLREVLKNSQDLDTLSLSEVTVEKKLPAINPVNMLSLKHLKIHHCEFSIAKFLNAQLTSLDLKSYLDGGEKSQLVNFINNQRLLKELTMRGTSARTLFQHDELIADCKFSLTKFHIEQDFGLNSDNVNWHSTAFLSLHTTTLKNVSICGPHCDQISGFVISNLDNLHSLVIDVRGLPKDEEFYEFMEQSPNLKLKQLTLRGFFVNPEAIKKIVKKYPAIEKLELNDWGSGNGSANILGFISKNIPHLQKLSIPHMSKAEVKFPSLKNLSVEFIRSLGKLLQFLKENPSVESLKAGVVHVGQINDDFLEELEDLNNMKHLSFGGVDLTLKSIWQLLMKKTPPKSLESIEFSLISDGSATGKATKLYFPIRQSSNYDLLKELKAVN